MLDPRNLDVEFLLDKSGSMGTNRDCPGNKPRWVYAQETTLALATSAEKYDPDGIAVTVFSGGSKTYDGVTGAKVAQVFAENEPSGSTNTAGAVKARLDAYLARKARGGAKSVLMIVMTDGEPDDGAALADVIIAATKRLDRADEVSILFVQIGTSEPAWAAMGVLDNDLKARGAKFDVVEKLKLSEVENFTFDALIQRAFQPAAAAA